MIRRLYFLVLFTLTLSACRVENISFTPSLQPSPKPALPFTQTIIPATPIVGEPIIIVTKSSTPLSSSAPASMPTPISTNPPIWFPIIHEQPDDLYTTVFSIPVGGNNIIHYLGGDNPDMEITGPDAIAVLPDDSFVIADLIANRLLRYDKAGNLLDKIELDDLGIVNVADLRARGYDLFLLEINSGFLPPRYRVNQLSINGKLIARYDIPESFGDAQGLTGIALDCDGSVLVELEGGYYLYRLKDFQNSVATPTPSGYYCNNQIFQIVRSDSPGRRALMAGDARYETQLTTDFGGLRLLNVFHDGSFYVSREDVVNDSVIKVDQTLHFINAEKENQGVARIPVAEAYYYIMRNTVANEKGEVFVLLPRRDSLDVVRLNFYQSLEPLPPSTIIPEVTLQTGQP